MLSFLWQNMLDMRATWLTHPHDTSTVLHPCWACFFLQQQWMTRQDAVLINADVRAEIIAFAGEPQYFSLGLVSRSWRGWVEGKVKNTPDSQIVTSVPRAMAAVGCG